MPRRPTFRQRVLATVQEHFLHVFEALLIILAIAFIHWVLGHLLGPEAKFFGLVPISYLFDAMKVGAILRLAVYATLGKRH